MHDGQLEEMEQPPSQPQENGVPYSRKTEGCIGKGTIIQEGHADQKDPFLGGKAQPTFLVGVNE